MPRAGGPGLAPWEDCVSGVWALGCDSGPEVGFRRQMALGRRQAQGCLGRGGGDEAPQDGPRYRHAWAP